MCNFMFLMVIHFFPPVPSTNKALSDGLVIKVPAAKLAHLSSVPGTDIREEETQWFQVVLWHTQTSDMAYP